MPRRILTSLAALLVLGVRLDALRRRRRPRSPRRPSRRHRRRRQHRVAGRSGPSASPSTGPRTRTTPGFFVAAAKDWYDDAGVDLQVLPYASTTPEALIAAGQAECGISFQDALTFAAAAGAPIVSVMAILQHTAQEIAVLASSDITRPRDLDGRTYAGFGYPNEEPTLQGRDQGRRRDGDLHDRDARHGGLRRAVREASGLRRSRSRPGRASRPASAASTCGPSPSATTASRTSTRSSSPATGDGSTASRTSRRRSSARPPAGSEFAADRPGRRGGAAGRPEPGRLRRQPRPARLPASGSSPTAATCVDAHGRGRAPDAGASGRATRASSTTRGCSPAPDGKPLTVAPDYAALFTNDYLP